MTSRTNLALVADDEPEPFGNEERQAVLRLGRQVLEQADARAPAASKAWWREDDSEMISLEEALSLLDVSVDDLLVVDERVPRFQFVGPSGRLAPVVKSIMELLLPVCVDVRTVAAWFAAPKTELGGLAPAQWIEDEREDDELVHVARRDAARLRA
jgi:hypothetical protein